MSASLNPEGRAACAVQVEGLTKFWGQTAVLRGVNLQVPSGNCAAILGPNGAGKTTLLRILATLSRPSGGRVRLDGFDLQSYAHAIRQRVGFASHATFLYGELSCLENLRFYGRMLRVSDLENRATELLERFGLAEQRGRLVRTLSRGMQQRLSLARAVLHRPEILLLDEPYASLDQQGADALAQMMSEMLGRGCTILLTTHDWRRGTQMGNQVVLLVSGRVVYEACGQTRSWEQLQAAYLKYTLGRA